LLEEARKNIIGIIKAFEILKEKYKIPHQLILAGKSGYGYKNIKCQILNAKYRNDIIETGFVNEVEKQTLLKGAAVFLFPSFYEGFGLPMLEAQSVGVPVVTSNVASMPEISTNYLFGTNTGTESCLLVDPKNHEQIAKAAFSLISDKALRDDIINKGQKNIKRFSWSECGNKIAKILSE
jgi:glycosyltransferase involved in cell wall biosynthesis